jgi:hypothetical protein
MVKVILGSALGGLVAGGIALFAAGQARGAVAPTAPVSFGAPVSMTQPVAPTVACGPNQEPAMARVLVNGGEAATLTCVERVPQTYMAYPQAGMVPQSQLVSLPGAAAPMMMPQAVPVVRSTPGSRTVPVRRVSYRDRDGDIVQYEPDRRPQGRSIAKTAMIIGGSAGTGAGIGAIVGGKKGALIGAAIGGGAASIYEARKR